MVDWAWPGTRRIEIRDPDLTGVTDINKAAEIDARRVGLSPRRVDRIWQAVEDVYRSRVHPGLSFCLRRDGEIVLDRAIGHARGVAPDCPPGPQSVAMAADTPVCMFSASKAVIAVLTHKLAETGAIDLDAPVSRYIPEFSGEGKTHTTLAQVLTHRGGFPCFPRGDGNAEVLRDWDACIARICRAPANAGGERLAYHAMTGGYILGEVIRRVTDKPLTAYLDKTLRKPLGMRYFTYGLDGRSRSRVAANHVAGMPVRWPMSKWAEAALARSFEDVVALSNESLFMDTVIPSGNLYATAEEISRFYQMMLDDGRYGDQQVLAPETVARLRRPAGRLAIDHMLKLPMRYSQGLMLGMNPVGVYGPMSGAAFGHVGFMNIFGWADPDRRLSVSLLTTGKALLGGHLIPLVKMLGQVNHECGGWRRGL
ncbi:serine hydrolase domain-containing protein [Salinisphaera japonica]|uniref:Beta-lactamase n=1 Tax=Salinisphaera japonica YTM-1 TaxID=1209778 RepID=A0A423PYF1_9GAMM|nr:serine hydrolase domain-containing protein [Salinisphaera japonica]ROO30634.1 beta-lactamase [Salinisphaera japonica YTM-1]